ncbi:hypothetical protein H9P43_003903 [Blastocladiella emersonii ATCC 22665]|nr:hypothetical protein H9P43_003903 [Blastocladiella emersonii ATCC 22665]
MLSNLRAKRSQTDLAQDPLLMPQPAPWHSPDPLFAPGPGPASNPLALPAMDDWDTPVTVVVPATGCRPTGPDEADDGGAPKIIESIEFNRSTIHSSMALGLARLEAAVGALTDLFPASLPRAMHHLRAQLMASYCAAFPAAPPIAPFALSNGDARAYLVSLAARVIIDHFASWFRRGAGQVRTDARRLWSDLTGSQASGVGYRPLPDQLALLIRQAADAAMAAVRDACGVDPRAREADAGRMTDATVAVVTAFAVVRIVHPLYVFEWPKPHARFDAGIAQPPARWLSDPAAATRNLADARVAFTMLPHVSPSNTEDPSLTVYRSVVVVYPGSAIHAAVAAAAPAVPLEPASEPATPVAIVERDKFVALSRSPSTASLKSIGRSIILYPSPSGARNLDVPAPGPSGATATR